jgi:hypothetical protein
MTFGHYGCCATYGCVDPKEPRKGSSDLRSHPVAMLLLLRKKRVEKPGTRRTYFRSGPLLDRATSGQGLFRLRDIRSKGPIRADMAQLPVAHAQNILPDRVISCHVTDVTSGYDVISGSTTSQHHLKW